MSARSTFEFILIDDFSMLSVVTAIEPLRVANRILGEDRYLWRVLYETGDAPMASNGLSLNDCRKGHNATDPDYTFVCAGMHTKVRDPGRLSATLNRRFNAGGVVGAVSLAPTLLARAGLLDGRRSVIHWEGLAAFTEEFPEIEISNGLFEIDGKIMTSCGGLATLDLFLEILKQDQESWLVQAIANQLHIGHARNSNDVQNAGIFRLPVTAPKLMHKAIALIDQTLSSPLTPEQMATEIGTSRRTMDRKFLEFTGHSFSEFYLSRRLEEARGLLRHSNISMLDVALATGFRSGSYFSTQFKATYGQSPRDYRKARS
ncbi:GlxA family transcriptional regulator [Cognatishimia activa]|uniref:Carnitine catabolism transcriptional activator n=1 Tax=Cognatishimia activa TaxID=1715691 RepID=A0A0P1IMF1_9RHOB|nr:GlxA family transcriptional regulator [Cognatishimia activa]CUI31990.1 Carnitine catabolism transcriptional activator [Cognatishimia activa]CUK24819.1 Carnitine catabolism transcriptional activator [Cognatishimia activa]